MQDHLVCYMLGQIDREFGIQCTCMLKFPPGQYNLYPEFMEELKWCMHGELFNRLQPEPLYEKTERAFQLRLGMGGAFKSPCPIKKSLLDHNTTMEGRAISAHIVTNLEICSFWVILKTKQFSATLCCPLHRERYSDHIGAKIWSVCWEMTEITVNARQNQQMEKK